MCRSHHLKKPRALDLEADPILEAGLLKKPEAEIQNLHNPSLEAASLEADLILEADLVWKQLHPNLWDIYHNPIKKSESGSS